MKHNFNEVLLQSKNIQKKEPSWLKHKRKEAIDSINSIGFPTGRHEEWKYTSLEEMYRTKLEMPSGSENRLSTEDIDSYTLVSESNIPRITLVNGRYSKELSETRSPDSKLMIRSLSDLLENDTEVAKSMFELETREAFSWLNTALINDGLLIECQENNRIEKPIHVINIISGESNKVVSPRIVVRANSNSKLTLLEEFVNFSPTKSLTNATTFINAEPGSEVNHHRISNAQGGYHVGNLHCEVNRDATVFSSSLALGGDITRINIKMRLKEPGASCDLSGLFLGLDEELIDHHTTIEHNASKTNSNEVYKGVMGRKSKGVFNGKVLVKENIFDVKASQNSNNLLLSDIAEINTKPELEIYSDDVSCAHGATVGQLDADSIFYLRARGISEKQAKRILIEAFIDEALSRLPVESIKMRVKEIIGKSNVI